MAVFLKELEQGDSLNDAFFESIVQAHNALAEKVEELQFQIKILSEDLGRVERSTHY